MIGIITARGGSKGIVQKNIAPLAGTPLIVYTLQAAIDADAFTRIIVSTDCAAIADVCAAYPVEVVLRPALLATDTASSVDTVAHVLSACQIPETEDFMLLQPTSPLRTAAHICAAIECYQSQSAAVLVSVCATTHPPHKCLVKVGDDYQPLFDWAHLSMPRQQLPETHHINGAIYICQVAAFLKAQSFFAEPLAIYEMDALSSVDIDTPLDLAYAEFLLQQAVP
ncbi:cytidylyltransferase domain-containing protein [Wohlfahrtiimonas chitiniclastica]|uniref:acylneuraminate cytidylyltransferase family protein n=1 Tax=Wohlfahrtiimonas chitiniclastica TaxID=400946 RepID=UPI00037436B9|nr:acylneuraminate cytidylyltransferase family protein [Wohlfahrtiimonas chitiniclastica]